MTIDEDGFRANVGIILVNQHRRLFWGRRVGQQAWQFPQGGIQSHETPEEALYRELEEEVGLTAHHVTCIAQTKEWLEYRIPKRFLRHDSHPLCVGQKQKWFLLRFEGDDNLIRFDAGDIPEFDALRWVSYWYPVHRVINFKQKVYRAALRAFAPVVFAQQFLTMNEAVLV
ncbi:MAG: RNA pyrophosphohydrolase [Gammaproteobacteria bacterium]